MRRRLQRIREDRQRRGFAVTTTRVGALLASVGRCICVRGRACMGSWFASVGP